MPRPPDASPDSARRLVAIAIALISVGTVLAGGLWVREQAITASDAQIRTQELALSRNNSPSDASAEPSVARVDASSPPRLLLSDAIYRARALQVSGSPSRDSDLAALSHQVDLAIDARPHWGQAWVVKAYVEALQTGSDHRHLSLVALSRSYSDAPFLRDAAGWRVRFAFLHWDELDAFVRGWAIEEAVWLARVDATMRKSVFASARTSQAYKPLVLRWREMRLHDGNYLAPPVARLDPR
ncbi:MAG: hypothetical protein QHC67_05680 [Sphingobium sp.]|uniref:hypothetical protein n=1 Tax=Sphingobium sp. TaxID=1912891 RepID=UPI0029BC1955|nr:hypothetical protein [Sphingobium sp.]MDX3909292.1 hypothetical protein [Sphingobium sp.]